MWFEPPEHNTLRPRENEVVLLKPGLARVSLSLSLSTDLSIDPCELASTRAFYSSRSDSYNESQGPTYGLVVGQTLCCRAQQLGVPNDILYAASSVELSYLIALLH
jgi:hypothetical protein